MVALSFNTEIHLFVEVIFFIYKQVMNYDEISISRYEIPYTNMN